jgi:ribose transport system ATP-binding protein
MLGRELGSLFPPHKHGGVLGLFGVRGSGRTAYLLRLQRELGPKAALVPEDRKRQGLFPSHDVAFHLALLRGEQRAAEVFPRLGIRGALDTPVRALSGGNQQKVVLGKAFAASPSTYLLDEPTRGVDIGAKAEIYAWVNALAEAGNQVVMASSEAEEVAGMCDRVLIMRRGQVASELHGADAATLLEAASA